MDRFYNKLFARDIARIWRDAMYEIRKDGAVLALTEKPTYIYRHEEGFYALCDEAQAQGLAVNGTPYSLHGRPVIEGCETVALIKADAGGILQKMEQTDGIAFVALAELAESQVADQTANELAMAELAEMIGG